MRTELEEMERIDNYLMNNMNTSERNAFEKEMHNNPELVEKVRLQSDLIKGVQRMVWESQVKTAKSSYRFNSMMKIVALSIAIAMAIVATVVLARTVMNQTDESTTTSEIVEPIRVLSKNYLDTQLFEIDNTKDTLLVSDYGMVFAIEKGTFGEAKNISLQLKEAFSARAMIKAKLSTESEGRPLETGGMFEWKAHVDGKAIEPLKEILVSIPTDEFKEDMMLFKGVEQNGTVDWREPEPIEQFLICEDMNNLNFYPPGYEQRLEELGYKEASKVFKDSLYYSFTAYLVPDMSVVVDAKNFDSLAITSKEEEAFYRRNSDDYYQAYKQASDKNRMAYRKIDESVVDPAKIAAIWRSRYNNTLLATKAFEERVRFIHSICVGRVIDYYVNNLEKPMYEIDEMVADYLKSIEHMNGYELMMEFAAKRQGRVEMDDVKGQLLREHYEEQQKEYRNIMMAAREKYIAEFSAAEKQATDIRDKRNRKIDSLAQATFTQELEMNMDEAYRQLGKKRPRAVIMESNYTFSVRSTGWYNVDRYVLESTVSRTTLDYTDPETGRKAVIRYDSLKIVADHSQDFDYAAVYLIPSQFKTYLLLNEKDSEYAYSCNELIDYKFIYLAYRGSQAYFYHEDKVKAKEYVPTLIPVTEEELNTFLDALDSPVIKKNLAAEIVFLESERKSKERRKRYEANQEIVIKLWYVVFPCGEWAFPSEVKKVAETQEFSN